MIFTTNKNIMMLMAPNVFTNIILHMFKVQQKRHPTQNKHTDLLAKVILLSKTGTSLGMNFPHSCKFPVKFPVILTGSRRKLPNYMKCENRRLSKTHSSIHPKNFPF